MIHQALSRKLLFPCFEYEHLGSRVVDCELGKGSALKATLPFDADENFNEEPVQSNHLSVRTSSIHHNVMKSFRRAEVELLVSTRGISLDAAQHVLDFVSNPRFDPRDITHRTMRSLRNKAEKRFFDTVHSIDLHQPLDGPQKVKCFFRDPIKALQSLLARPELAGLLTHEFQKREILETGERVWEGFASGDAFKRACDNALPNCRPAVVIMHSDASYAMKHLHFHAVHRECQFLSPSIMMALL
jgi:hypothetical protein